MNVTYGHVGDRIERAEQMEELPPGSVIYEASSPDNKFTKREDGRWQRGRDGSTFRPNQFAMGGRNVVESIPDGWVSRPRPQENVQQHMWTFRDRALWSAHNHSVDYHASDMAIAEMGARREEFPLGRGVRITNPTDRDQLPNGTVVYSGDPARPERFGMFEKVNGRWKHLLGEQQAAPAELTIHTFAGSTEQPDWLAREGTEEDAEAIANFRAKAWQVGWRLKQSQGWCSTYEAVMRDMGLTAAAVRAATHRGVRVGDTVRPDMAHDLPNGAIFQWTSSNDTSEVAFFVRTMTSDNRAGTLRIGGSASSTSNRNYRSSMRVLFLPTPDEPYGWQPDDPAGVFALLNPGVYIGMDTLNPNYIKAMDGKVEQVRRAVIDHQEETPPSGRWNLRDFGRAPNMYVVGFKGVEL